MSFQTIIDYAKKCVLENYANFNGRARRAEYWSFALCTGVISAVLNILYQATNAGFFNILATLFALAVLVPRLAPPARHRQEGQLVLHRPDPRRRLDPPDRLVLPGQPAR